VAMASLERLQDGRCLALFQDDRRFLRKAGQRTDRMWVFKIFREGLQRSALVTKKSLTRGCPWLYLFFIHEIYS